MRAGHSELAGPMRTASACMWGFRRVPLSATNSNSFAAARATVEFTAWRLTSMLADSTAILSMPCAMRQGSARGGPSNKWEVPSCLWPDAIRCKNAATLSTRQGGGMRSRTCSRTCSHTLGPSSVLKNVRRRMEGFALARIADLRMTLVMRRGAFMPMHRAAHECAIFGPNDHGLIPWPDRSTRIDCAECPPPRLCARARGAVAYPTITVAL